MTTKNKKIESKKPVKSSVGAEALVYKTTGKEVGKVKLPAELFSLPWNANLVYEIVNSMRTNARQPVAHTKTRADVRGGGKKPWRQKGTGRARHGSTRSPLWVGGGVAHGPRNDQNFSRKINKKTKVKAFFTILSKKLKNDGIIFVDKFDFKTPKTKIAVDSLLALPKIQGFEKLSYKKENAAIIAVAKKDSVIEKSFRNIGSVRVEEIRNLNPLDLLGSTYIIFENPEEAVKILEAKLSK